MKHVFLSNMYKTKLIQRDDQSDTQTIEPNQQEGETNNGVVEIDSGVVSVQALEETNTNASSETEASQEEVSQIHELQRRPPKDLLIYMNQYLKQ